MTYSKMIPTDSNIAIYGEPANINYFVTTDLEPASEGAVVDKSSSVKTFKRRRFVGDDEPVSVVAHTREYMFDPGRRNGGGTPGKPFILDDGTERRQFSFTGTVKDLHAYIVGEAAMDLTLFSPSASYTITAAAEAETAA